MALVTPAPLDPAWLPLLARTLGRPVPRSALAVMVARLSAHYTDRSHAPLAPADALAARALFFFARDVPKLALPLAELVAARALPSRPLRVLDLGAGLGASTVGVLRALAGRAEIRSLDLFDHDPIALAFADRVLRDASREGLLAAPLPAVTTRVADLETPPADLAPYDLVVAVNAFVETTRHDNRDDISRANRLVESLSPWLSRALAPDGALVLVEPALRVDTRALHHARGVLLERSVHVFAPCPHEGACPMLADPRDWCHEDLAVDLTDELVPLAREAGLRWQGLTFSYLTLQHRRTGDANVDVSVRDLVRRDAATPVRLVSRPLVSKGKTEVHLCGAMPTGATGTRGMQLDRSAKGARDGVLATMARGDVIAVRTEVLAGDPARIAPGDVTDAAADAQGVSAER